MITVWYKGISGCNGGATFGVVIKKDSVLLYSHCQRIAGKRPTDMLSANYAGLHYALTWLLGQGLQDEPIMVLGDLTLIRNQLWGTWKIKTDLFDQAPHVPLALQTKDLLKEFSNITGEWINGEQNQEAKDLARSVLYES